MLEQLLLESVASKKLQIYGFLTKGKQTLVTPANLRENFSISYNRLQALLEEIQFDLEKIGITQSLWDETGNLICLNNPDLYMRYRSYLYNQSLPYKFVLTSLLEPEKNAEVFLKENFTSRASLARKLTPLSEYLQEIGLKMNRSQIKISGEEKIVRVFYFNVCWFISYGADVISNVDFIGSITPSDFLYLFLQQANQQAWKLMTAITHLRHQQGFFVNDEKLEELYFPNIANPYPQLFGETIDYHGHEAAEVDYLCFSIFYWPNYFDIKDPRLPFVMHSFDDNFLHIKELAKDLIADIKGGLLNGEFDDEAQTLMKANLFVVFYNQDLTSASVPLLSAFMTGRIESQKTFYPFLYKHIYHFLKEKSKTAKFRWLGKRLEDLVYLSALIILPKLEITDSSARLKVGLIPGPNFAVIHAIQNFLYDLNYVDAELLTNVEERSCDFYISSSPSFLADIPPEKIFVANSFEGDDYLSELYLVLKKAYLQKKLQLLAPEEAQDSVD
ncbi:helix-turn-helix domain-containing protein [Enterococcus sp. LJL120]